jgi:hypothetical protein
MQEGRKDGWMDGWKYGWMDGWMDGSMDGWMRYGQKISSSFFFHCIPIP